MSNAVVDQVSKQLFIGGQWVDAQDSATFEVLDPATGKVLCEVADASPQDARAALDAVHGQAPDLADRVDHRGLACQPRSLDLEEGE